MTSSVLNRYVACSSTEVSNPNLLDNHKTYRTQWSAKRAARKMNTGVFKVRIQYKNWLVRYATRFFRESLHSKNAFILGGLGILSLVAMVALFHQGVIDEVHAMTLPALIFTFYTYDVLTDAWLYMPSRQETFEPMFSTLVASPWENSYQTAAFFDYWEKSTESVPSGKLVTV